MKKYKTNITPGNTFAISGEVFQVTKIRSDGAVAYYINVETGESHSMFTWYVEELVKERVSNDD